MQPAIFRAAIGVITAIAATGAAAQNVDSQKFAHRLHPVAEPIKLDTALTEVSGLADAGGGRLFAHNDEHAVVYELDLRSGRILRKLSYGAPPVAGDFEAIVAHDEKISLLTSEGLIYSASVDADRNVTRTEVVDTKLGATCELESLAKGAAGEFFLACKEAKKRLVVYRWSAAAGPHLLFRKKLTALTPNPKGFRATDMIFDKSTKTFLILDSSVGALLEVTLSGKSAGYWRLGGRHQQAEGLALLSTGEIIVADEGKEGKGHSKRGYLTIYPPR